MKLFRIAFRFLAFMALCAVISGAYHQIFMLVIFLIAQYSCKDVKPTKLV